MRILLMTLSLSTLALAQTSKDLRTVYDWLREGLCAANITCAFPRDAILPADFKQEIEPLLLRQTEVILVGTPTDLGDALVTLSKRFASDPQNWPRLYIVTPKEDRPYYRVWEAERYKPYITLVDSSSSDSLSTLSKFGFPMVLLDNQRVWIPSWWSLDGPTVASLVLLARQTIQTLRNAQTREAGTR